jgi:hypothetical protein
MKGILKSQSAMEYLMTYGWAILILGIVASALFALGIFNPGQSASQVCQLEAGFICANYYMVQNGILTLNIIQSTTVPVNITAVGCNTNSTLITTQNIKPQDYMPIGSNVTINVQCYDGSLPFSGKINQLYLGNLQLNYTDATTGFPQIIYGNIAVRISR